MLVEPGERVFAFVVDTDTYAGSFERELCVYVTGQYSEETCNGFVEKYIKLIKPEKEYLNSIFENLVTSRLCEHDGYGHQSPVVIFPTPGYSNDGDGNACKVDAEHPFKYPSYQSVAIFMDKRPDDATIKLMKERVDKFLQRLPRVERFKLIGYRIIECTVDTKSEDV